LKYAEKAVISQCLSLRPPISAPDLLIMHAWKVKVQAADSLIVSSLML